MAVTPRLALPVTQGPDGMNVNPPAFKTIWQNVDAAIGPTFCTSSTRPGAPYACQWIYETDTLRHYIWDTVSNAWVQLILNPTGLAGISTSVATTIINLANSNFLISSIAPMTVEQGRNYRIHTSGVYGYTNNSGSTGTQTAAAAKASIVANFANGSTTTVTAASTALQSQYVDAWSAIGLTQRSFHFEVPWASGSNTQLSVGLIVNVPVANSGCSNFFCKSGLTYVEQC